MAQRPGQAWMNQAPAQISLTEQRRLVQEGWDAVCALLQATYPPCPLVSPSSTLPTGPVRSDT